MRFIFQILWKQSCIFFFLHYYKSCSLCSEWTLWTYEFVFVQDSDYTCFGQYCKHAAYCWSQYVAHACYCHILVHVWHFIFVDVSMCDIICEDKLMISLDGLELFFFSHCSSSYFDFYHILNIFSSVCESGLLLFYKIKQAVLSNVSSSCFWCFICLVCFLMSCFIV